MTRMFYIMVLVMMGFLLGPTAAIANVNKTEMSCCKEKSPTKDCCKKEKSEMNGHSCDNSCTDNACVCAAQYCSFTPMSFYQTGNSILLNFSQKKQSFYYSEIFISRDFRSIWLPPKIS